MSKKLWITMIAIAGLYNLGGAIASLPAERQACIDAANNKANKCMGENPTRELQISCSKTQSLEIEECNKIGEIKDVTVPRKTQNPLFGKTNPITQQGVRQNPLAGQSDPRLPQRAEGKDRVRVTLANPKKRDAALEAFAKQQRGDRKSK